jgi:hypothetical protein
MVLIRIKTSSGVRYEMDHSYKKLLTRYRPTKYPVRLSRKVRNLLAKGIVEVI